MAAGFRGLCLMRLNERIVSGFGNACMTGYRALSRAGWGRPYKRKWISDHGRPSNERDASPTRPKGKGGLFVPEEARSVTILEYYRRADEARRMADAASSPFERADFLEVEKRWLALARSAHPSSDPSGWGRGKCKHVLGKQLARLFNLLLSPAPHHR
jgi:hypothetical protein